jgi:hypothetical protein
MKPYWFGKRRLAISLRALLVFVALLCALFAWERHVVVERRSIRRALEREGVATFSSSALAAQAMGLAPGDPALARVNWLRRLFGDEAIDSITLWKPSDEAAQALRWFPEARIGRAELDPFLHPQKPEASDQRPAATPGAPPIAPELWPLPALPLSHERFVD